jgi:hypothetical protein
MESMSHNVLLNSKCEGYTNIWMFDLPNAEACREESIQPNGENLFC